MAEAKREREFESDESDYSVNELQNQSDVSMNETNTESDRSNSEIFESDAADNEDSEEDDEDEDGEAIPSLQVVYKANYEKGEYLAIRGKKGYDIGILMEDYGTKNTDKQIEILWLRLKEKDNPLVFEIDNIIKAQISHSVIGAVEVDFKLSYYHISKQTHDEIRRRLKHIKKRKR